MPPIGTPTPAPSGTTRGASSSSSSSSSGVSSSSLRWTRDSLEPSSNVCVHCRWRPGCAGDDDDDDEEEEEDGPCVALAAGLEGCRGAADDTCEQQPRPAEPRQAGGEDGKADGKGTKRKAHVHDPTPPLPPPPLRPPPASQPSLGRAAAGGMGAGSGGDDESAAMQASQLRSNLLHTLLRWCPRVLLQAEEPELVLLPKPRAALPRSYASATHYVDANAEYLKLEVQP